MTNATPTVGISEENTNDPVNHPKHYTDHPSGIECIQVTEHMGFNLGNAVKYVWRCDLKLDAIEDLKKAVWYIEREIAKREAAAKEAAKAAHPSSGSYSTTLHFKAVPESFDFDLFSGSTINSIPVQNVTIVSNTDAEEVAKKASEALKAKG